MKTTIFLKFSTIQENKTEIMLNRWTKLSKIFTLRDRSKTRGTIFRRKS